MKLLIAHGNDASFLTLIEKIKKLNAKAGPFTHILIVGDVKSETIDNIGDVSDLPTLYIFGAEGESTIDIVQLNGFGVYECQDKLTIGYTTQTTKQLNESKKALWNKFKQLEDPVDIFISREWSSKVAALNELFSGTELLDNVVKMTQPKYHIAYGDNNHYFESKPFIWEDSNEISRFINIADFDSAKKWAYAFNLDMIKGESDNCTKKLDLIDSPYNAPSQKRALSTDKHIGDNNKVIVEPKQKRAKKVLPSTCHFCFTNASLADHMIISIGNSSYLTIVKGPLTTPKGDMDFSGHCLLIPIEHIPKYNVGQDKFSESTLVKEMTDYENSVVKMNYRKFDMSTIVFEINSERSIHFHKQIIPVPKYLIMKFEAALDRQLHFNNENFFNNAKLNFKKYSSTNGEYLKIRDDPKSNYLQFTVYETSEVVPKVYIAMFQSDMRLDLQFGRRVAAFLLKLPKRIKWDSPACLQSKEQEIMETEHFQKGYKEFDIMTQI
ncbi:similar to Saccharomyces cerevisiae YGR093W Putative protein of unconfirmed function [Maudiozyma barnettii]|uniref:Cwf19-like C-terminal domain-containing protein n=1 Tax=Maudiozyma barnettii TaxID=61262 RepID=A0A8H2VAW5_9SACH|nr:Drn1p [Kazachstania barnettii]CAB4251895.1 similar to Saccharomyces cerevisiae YGR093W Putative protein of unconfirmed function [Kazachstania barnettii]CAD1778211.1 similar to Saccharomyces cerevisiae YGR093W Putative protein of unconfirmed function [Kazachstania barnettii]